jgi:parvulin-like peptidyl-prolyl isomerase
MLAGILILVSLLPPAIAPQAPGDSTTRSGRVVDRIAARIENDVILQSQVRQLGAFQQLVEGHSESDAKLLDELIEQWIVQTEAEGAHFPHPAKSEVDREMARLAGQYTDPGKYQARLNEVGLSANDVRDMLTRQIYAERYLDSKFRPAVQVGQSDIDAYYKNELVPELAKKNESPPARSAVQEEIREVLVQRAISNLTIKWLDDTKSRLRIEIEKPGDPSR